MQETQAEVTALDVYQPFLDHVQKRAKEIQADSRLRTKKMSMEKMNFPEGSFDLIWAEGSSWVIGFEKALIEWRRLLRPYGFLVIHEMAWLKPDPPPEIRDYWQRRNPDIKTVDQYQEIIPKHGYRLVDSFTLPQDLWWDEYYGPLQERIRKLREKYRGDSLALNKLESEQQEVDLFKRHMEYYGSAFFVLEKY